MTKEKEVRYESESIIMGAERPMHRYLDERREIHLRRNVEVEIPKPIPTMEFGCDNCHEEIVVFYEMTTPAIVECPSCHHENNLVKCVNPDCQNVWQEGDQAFIELDVPYGSRVADSLFGPAYACSARCLSNAFRYDIFDAKDDNRPSIDFLVEASRAKKIVEGYAAKIGSLLLAGSPAFETFEQLKPAVLEQVPAEGLVTEDEIKSLLQPLNKVLAYAAEPDLEEDELDEEKERLWQAYVEAEDRLSLQIKYGEEYDYPLN